jgi:hypothetical protein
MKCEPLDPRRVTRAVGGLVRAEKSVVVAINFDTGDKGQRGGGRSRMRARDDAGEGPDSRWIESLGGMDTDRTPAAARRSGRGTESSAIRSTVVLGGSHAPSTTDRAPAARAHTNTNTLTHTHAAAGETLQGARADGWRERQTGGQARPLLLLCVCAGAWGPCARGGAGDATRSGIAMRRRPEFLLPGVGWGDGRRQRDIRHGTARRMGGSAGRQRGGGTAGGVSLLRCARGRRDSLRDAPSRRGGGEWGPCWGPTSRGDRRDHRPRHAMCARGSAAAAGPGDRRGAPGRCTAAAAARARTGQVVSSAFGWQQSSAGDRKCCGRDS